MTCPPGIARGGQVFFLAALLAAGVGTPARARADHPLEYFPSFYPHEIRIQALDPAAASKLLAKHSLHAYVGGDPFAGRTPPSGLGHVDSLGSYLVLTFDGAAASDRNSRCEGARGLLGALAAAKGEYVLHPYPVTPFHADYLSHFDLAEAARQRWESAPGASEPPGDMRLRANGRLAMRLVPPARRATGRKWDATLEEIDVQGLVAPARASVNWLGPPWLKEGWFHAYLLQAPTLTDVVAKRDVDALYGRLVTGGYEGETERIGLERKLVGLLGGGCERVVLGYTARREYFNNSDYTEGIENIGYDAHAGLNAPIFVRTVKLKDFLWNGWLRLGVETRPRAAWNPMGGFTDAAGRLIWSTVGDPAELPAPQSATWVPARVSPAATTAEAASKGLPIPPDALLPEAGTGLLKPVGTGKTARAKVLYRVRLSSFHDGTPMTAADVLYALGFAYRTQDRFVEGSTRLLREWLAGVRMLQAEEEVREFGEKKYTFQVQITEVYLTRALADPLRLGSVAPPWSTLPWHVIAVMEEAVKRGRAALSQDEAKRRGVPWLDLVRDQRVKGRLVALVDEFARNGYVPPSLKGLLTSDQARARWAALKEFYAKNRHFLVTNGPYRLHQWAEDGVVLQAFRDPSYPLGIGAFDRYATPRRAYVSKLEIRDGWLEIRAEVEKVFRFQRSYQLVREPFRGQAGDGDAADPPVCRYVVIGADGSVAATGRTPFGADGAVRLDLKGALKPGLYRIAVALSLGGNEINPEVKTMRLTLGGF
ncbi:MAG: hypothetical protein HYY64_16190 [Candidatus Rokubacteria bacterium]|nr:hypothetical protein [Candidatus Rokubacteria bacterium]